MLRRSWILFVVDLKIADTEQELPRGRLPDVREDVGDGERDDTWRRRGALHGEGLSCAGHSVGEDGSVVTFHDPPNQSFRDVVVYLAVVIMCRENII